MLMNTHILIAQNILRDVDVDFKISDKNFIYGNVKPDMVSKYKLKKHYLNESFDMIVNMIKKLKNEGYMVVLISASPEFYVKEFYAIEEVDLIIGTKFTFEGGKFIRKMSGNNCKGEEKVRRLNEVLKEKNIKVDFKNSYMFSDSLSDKPLLDLVGNPYLINYKKKHEIEILRWK